MKCIDQLQATKLRCELYITADCRKSGRRDKLTACLYCETSIYIRMKSTKVQTLGGICIVKDYILSNKSV